MNARKYAKEKRRSDLAHQQAQTLQLLGLTESPIAQFSSLVNTLNALQGPGIQQEQFGQELGLKQNELEQRAQAQLQQWEMHKAEMGLREREFVQRGELGREELGSRERLRAAEIENTNAYREQESENRVMIQDENRQARVMQGLMNLLQISPNLFGKPEEQISTPALLALLERMGLEGATTLTQGGASAVPRPGFDGMNRGGMDDQAVLEALQRRGK